MHELSLAGGVLRLIEDAQKREGFERVAAITLEVGALAGVDVRALRFALSALAPGTLLAGAAIELVEKVGVAFCFGCSEHVEIASRADACSRCGAYQLQPIAGTELKLIELTVHDA